MRRFRSRQRNVNWRSVRRVVRAVSAPTITRRLALPDAGISIPARTAAAFDNELKIPLLVSQETQDEEVEANGTVPAQIGLGYRLKSFRFNLKVVASSSQIFRWMLVKFPDGEDLYPDLTNTTFHNSDDSATMREVRKYTLAKGFIIADNSGGSVPLKVFVRNKALKRANPFRENDQLTLAVANSTATAASLHGFGTMYVQGTG